MLNRRAFVQLGSVAVVTALGPRARAAEPLPALPEDNPQAVALKYTEDVSANPPEGYSAGSGQNCANCLHYGELDDAWGTCALFPGHRVHAEGWCSAWAKKA